MSKPHILSGFFVLLLPPVVPLLPVVLALTLTGPQWEPSVTLCHQVDNAAVSLVSLTHTHTLSNELL